MPTPTKLVTPPALPYQVLRIVTKWKLTDTDASVRYPSNSFEYAYQSGGTPGYAQKASLISTAVTGFKALVQAQLLLAMNPLYASFQILAKFLDVVTDPYDIVDSSSAAATGTAGDALPARSCFTMQKKSGIAGRNYRGSWHFPGVSEADTTFDEINGSTGLANWITNLKPKLLSNISDGTFTYFPIILSSSQSVIEMTPTSINFAALTALVANKTLGDMKKRIERPRIYV